MLRITLSDGKKLSYPESEIDGFQIAKSISSSLAKSAIAFKIDGVQKDLAHKVKQDSEVEIITVDSEEGLEILRHDAAHLLAHAVKELYPDVQVTIGPTIDNGFYYDFVKDEPFTLQDLKKIEAQMKKLSSANHPIKREVKLRDEAIRYFEGIGEHYKVEIIKDLPDDEEISLYSQGDFTDLCRGPHGPFNW